MNKKAIIIIVVSVVLLIASIFGLSFIFSRSQEKEERTNTSNTASMNSLKPTLSKIYEKMLQGQIYTFSLILDDNNKTVTVRNGEKARIDFYENGVHITNIVKDGMTYQLMHKEKQYYEYGSNTVILTNLLRKFERTKENVKTQKGEETLNNILYYYEEYPGTAEFLFNNKGIDTKQATTKFYYQDDKLVYIKTILPDKEELLKIEMSYTSGNTSFDVPADYQKVEV